MAMICTKLFIYEKRKMEIQQTFNRPKGNELKGKEYEDGLKCAK